jgi:hypothetical protein
MPPHWANAHAGLAVQPQVCDATPCGAFGHPPPREPKYTAQALR